MKKYFNIILLLFFTTTVFSLTNEELIQKPWSVEVLNDTQHAPFSFTFKNSNEYIIKSPYGGYITEGKFSFENNQLKVEKPNDVSWEVIKNLFDDKTLIFNYFDNTDDFYCTDLFKNNKAILRNFKNRTPTGTKCNLSGISVIKQSGKEKVVALENLRLRERPSLSAPTASFNYTGMMLINMYSTNDEDRQFIANKINFENEMKMQILIAGLAVEYDAITSFEETIDGIKAPWYRILLYNYSEEGSDETFWVFGGYLEKENKEKDYKKLIFDNAKIKGLIK